MHFEVDGCLLLGGMKGIRVAEMDVLWSVAVGVGFYMPGPRKNANSHWAFGIEGEVDG